jgi:hypothetical protein
MVMTTKTTKEKTMAKNSCKLCDEKPSIIWTQAFNTYICKPCMTINADTHNDKIGKYPNNYIPSDYYTLINN